MQLSTDKTERKEMPIARGCMDYFPDAIAAVANVSFVGNEQHNPGEEMHWAREKSNDHADCIGRHLIERGGKDDDGVRHTAKLAWRALALLQLEIEAEREVHNNIKETLIDDLRLQVQKEFPMLYDKSLIQSYKGSPIISVPKLDPTQDEPEKSDTQQEYKGCLLFDPAKCTFEEAQDFIKRYTEAKEGELLEVENCIVDGCTFFTEEPTKKVYIAGPMRGYPTWNFAAFDSARDYFISEGWDVISPADIDREEWGGDPLTDMEVYAYAVKEVENWDRNRLNSIISRDVEAILSSDAIALLPGWEKSTGAVAEFFVARWSGAQVLDATTGLPFETVPNLTAILLATLDYIESGE